MSDGAALPLWPPADSAHAQAVDHLFFSFTAFIAVIVVPLLVLLVYFAIRYRRGSNADRGHRIRRTIWFEASWTVIPFALSLAFYAWAASLYFDLFHPPAGALEIDVVAKQWMWKFQHPGGQSEINTLHVPTGRPVKLTMISQDAIHSLFLPALRIKQDVLPGRYTDTWFEAVNPGEYRLMCAEFCGTSHSNMGGRLVVMTPTDYQAWLAQSGTDLSLAAQGKILFRRFGCSGCHENSDAVHAPRLEGLFGGPVPLAGGAVVTADEGYIRDSILLPQKQVAAGYKPIMPTFKNKLSEGDLIKLIAYIKSLGTAAEEEP